MSSGDRVSDPDRPAGPTSTVRLANQGVRVIGNRSRAAIFPGRKPNGRYNDAGWQGPTRGPTFMSKTNLAKPRRRAERSKPSAPDHGVAPPAGHSYVNRL